jgi:hypothetical protein
LERVRSNLAEHIRRNDRNLSKPKIPAAVKLMMSITGQQKQAIPAPEQLATALHSILKTFYF